MGNIFTPQSGFGNKQPVKINGFSFSKDHVPSEIYRYGRTGLAVQTTKMMQSKQSCPTVYVTRVYFPDSKHYETFLTKDLSAA